MNNAISVNGTAEGFDGVQTGSTLSTDVEPGAVSVMASGVRMECSSDDVYRN